MGAFRAALAQRRALTARLLELRAHLELASDDAEDALAAWRRAEQERGIAERLVAGEVHRERQRQDRLETRTTDDLSLARRASAAARRRGGETS
jgi:flagellar biosynthesis chaperone FliJ